MDIVDVRGLTEEEAQKIQELVELFKKRTQSLGQQSVFSVKQPQVIFGTFPLGAKGNITREEIYDYL